MDSTISGHGGELNVKSGQTVVMIVSFDYEPANYRVSPEQAGFTPLSGTADGVNMAKLARAANAKTFEYYDKSMKNSLGHPDKAVVVSKLKEIGSQLGEDDMFVFFFSGHGCATESENDDEIAGNESGATELCICDQSGTYNPLKDSEIAEILKDDFNAETDILFITDCCQSGTVCNLADPEFGDRPICHIAAVKDSQFALDWGGGGALTTSLVEALEDIMQEEDAHEDALSLVKVFNAAYAKFKRACEFHGDKASTQVFMFERTPELDPDSVEWPLMPPAGWKINTMFDEDGIR